MHRKRPSGIRQQRCAHAATIFNNSNQSKTIYHRAHNKTIRMHLDLGVRAHREHIIVTAKTRNEEFQKKKKKSVFDAAAIAFSPFPSITLRFGYFASREPLKPFRRPRSDILNSIFRCCCHRAHKLDVNRRIDTLAPQPRNQIEWNGIREEGKKRETNSESKHNTSMRHSAHTRTPKQN